MFETELPPALAASHLSGHAELAHSRLAMAAALEAYLDAADAYRHTVQDYMHSRRAAGASQRRVAQELGITEGALRDLLRPTRRRR